jgi:hypothetical protein
MESPLRGHESADDRIQSQPSTNTEPLHSLTSQRETASPTSPASDRSFATERDARIEGIISPGPARTVQLKRQSVPGAKPRYVITDVERMRHWRAGASATQKQRLANGTQSALRSSRKANLLVQLALFISTMVVLGAFVFLLYLWLVRDSTWRSIVFKNWAVRAITLASTVIWLATELQALIAGAMLFCLLSSSTNSSSSTRQYILLRKTHATKRLRFVPACALALVLVSAALHFIPTLLLSDFGNGLLASGNGNTKSIPYSLDDAERANLTRGERDFTSLNPSQFPTFGEFAVSPASQQAGVDDTGESIRAFLPLASSSERTSISTYQGRATLVNSRVICLAPVVENATYSSLGLSTSPDSPTQQLQGLLSTGNSIPSTLKSEPNASNEFSFVCNFELAQSGSEWPITLCSVQSSNGSITIDSPFANGIMADTSTFVLLNHTMNSTIPISANVGNVSITSWKSDLSGAWTNLTYTPNPMFSIQLSFCFVSTGTLDAEIEATGTQDRTEPTMNVTKGDSIYKSDVSAILNQLDVSTTNATAATQRAVLPLKSQNPWGSSTNSKSALQSPSTFSNKAATYGLCTFCGGYASSTTTLGIASTLSIIFQRALQDSGSPAKALQALFTVTNGMQYYSRYVALLTLEEICSLITVGRLPYFDISTESRIDNFVEVYHPKRYTGITAVGAELALHLIIVILIAVLFTMRTNGSLVEQLRQHFLGYRVQSTNEATSEEESSG